MICIHAYQRFLYDVRAVYIEGEDFDVGCNGGDDDVLFGCADEVGDDALHGIRCDFVHTEVGNEWRDEGEVSDSF